MLLAITRIDMIEKTICLLKNNVSQYQLVWNSSLLINTGMGACLDALGICQ